MLWKTVVRNFVGIGRREDLPRVPAEDRISARAGSRCTDAMKRNADRMDRDPFLEEVPEQTARAAWLYYVGGYRQEQTAKLLGVSRLKVHKILSEARDLGIVKFSIRHRFARIAEVEESIRRKYHLKMCRVTPPLAAEPGERQSPSTQAQLAEQGPIARRGVSIVAAELLDRKLRADERSIVGVGWGRTISQIPLHLTETSRPKVKFVSVIGSLTKTSAANPLDVASLFARMTGAEGYFLPAPYIANSVADRRVFMSQIAFQETLTLAQKATFYLVSVGRFDEHSPLSKQRHLSKADVRGLKRAGAVCDFMGKFFDTEGRIVDHDVNERTLAVDLEHLQKRDVVLLSAGQEKLPGVRGLLKAGLVNGLVIDGDSAFRLAWED